MKIKKGNEGKVFFVVSFVLFVSILLIFINSNNSILYPKWVLFVLLFSTIINVIQSMKNKRKYYMYGSIMLSICCVLALVKSFY
ncbi:hypothetical protein CN514_00725 [Bacillus sp. AFS001701]|uniref:hypothetical protein n=1 Tax=Bacillus sp. AFS001701 TaxID=2033480 RepID=UPI000BF517CE|nr:hypothetical protein [Bacillus sp. AFS001701]PET77554.1 hypothetical protein CN514_00725 [Bacillus sp. AFS001701]